MVKKFSRFGLSRRYYLNLLEREHLTNLNRIYIAYEPDSGGPGFSFGLRKRLEDLGFPGDIYETRLPVGIKDVNQLLLLAPDCFHRSFKESIDASICIRPALQAALGWDLPHPFDAIRLPAFPVNALPKAVAGFVDAEAEATQTPVDLAAMLSLAVLATVCAKKFEVEVKPGYIEPTNLFVLVVLPPANRKSAVYRDVTQPLVDFEQSEVQRLLPVVAAERERIHIDEETLKKLREQASKPDAVNKHELLTKAQALAEQLATTKMPRLPQLIADDCTPERLATLLSEQGGRMAVMSPEGDVFDIIAGRYSHDRGPNLGVYLKGHSGDDLRVERSSREGEHVPSPAITMALTVQPLILQGLSARPGFHGRGLLGRFLYSRPNSLLGSRNRTRKQ